MKFVQKVLDYLTGRSLRAVTTALQELTVSYQNLYQDHISLGNEFASFRATTASKIRDAERAARTSSNKIGVRNRRAAVREQTAPMLPDFPYDPQNVQWVGGTFDFIVYEGRTKDTDPISLVFLDVKTGKSSLNDRQKRLKEAISAGRIRFEVYRPKVVA
jgi:predicted Holliday junction resolvase-like endonuclease